jgi:hypothetical protein
VKYVVYILGAGCSANFGYPLAKCFRATLKEYADKLGQRSNCQRLRQSVDNTVKLMEQHNSRTVDRLVSKLVDEIHLQRQPLGIVVTQRHCDLDRQEREQILDAKRATVALFLERETSARRSGLQGYREFLETIFEGNRDPDVLRSTSRRVLSFNYDRLFEIAFGEFFRLKSDMSLYGQARLNSGLNLFSWGDPADVDLSRFSLLKLHGTAGIRVSEQDGQSRYGWYANLNQSDIIVEDKLFWPETGKPSAHLREPEPLIAFPFEKDRARSGGTSFLFDNYLRTIWGHRGKAGYAEQLIQEAKKIWVIGYSFDPHDRTALIELLRKSGSCPIFIRSETKEEARRICEEELSPHYDDLAPRLTPIGKPF